ncbi:conjugal transfer protein TraH [Eoetvoesiella caeni]
MAKTRKPHYLRFSALAGAFLLSIPLLAGFGNSKAAGLQDNLNGLFDSMVNYTEPGVYETQRRGVFSGGRFTTKNRIFQENVINFTPPSWKGGCGGIDLFGGSFSFINAEQLTQLLRSIAANAAGYAFQLALDNICKDCMKHITTLQNKIQSLNQHLGNSCQLAQGLVNDLTSGMDIKNKTDQSLVGTAKGFFEDIFSSKQQTGGKSSVGELNKRDPETLKAMSGNLVWKMLKENSVQFWFAHGDNELLESVMSLTGTIIIQEPSEDPKQPGGSENETQKITTLAGRKISLSEFINGGDVSMYSCQADLDECNSAGAASGGIKTIKIKGIKTQLTDALLGPNNDPGSGIVGKFARNSGNLTPTERALMGNLPSSMGAIVRNLAVLSETSARQFVDDSAGAIALVLTHKFVDEFFRAGRLAIASSDSPFIPKVHALFKDSQDGIRSEYQVLTNQYGQITDQVNKYNILLTNLRKQKYMLGTLTNQSK